MHHPPRHMRDRQKSIGTSGPAVLYGVHPGFDLTWIKGMVSIESICRAQALSRHASLSSNLSRLSVKISSCASSCSASLR